GELARLLGLADEQHAALAALLPALSSWRARRDDAAVLDAARYRVQWRPIRAAAAPVLDGTWLVVTAEGIDDGEITAALRGHGALFERLVLDPHDRDRARLAARLAEAGCVSGVLSVLPLADRPDGAAAGLPPGLALSALLAQALGDTGLQCPAWTVTRGAVSTGPGDPVLNPVQAAVWGLNRAVALERPQPWSGLIDLPEILSPVTVQHLASILAGSGGEDQVAIRAAAVMGRRLVRGGGGVPRAGKGAHPRRDRRARRRGGPRARPQRGRPSRADKPPRAARPRRGGTVCLAGHAWRPGIG